MRVGFTMIGGGRGTGVYNYLLNLLNVLDAHTDVTSVLFLGEDCGAEEAAPFEAIARLEIVRSKSLDAAARARVLAASLVFGEFRPLRALFERHRLDALFESARFYGWRLPFPVIAWIPDFQHRVLPGMFTRRGYWKREIGFQVQIASRRVFMLSSDDARRSCERFYPRTIGRTRTVRFAVPPGSPPSLAEARTIASHYGLPRHFVFMPNQLSKHKNHLLVIDALAMLRQRGTPVCIAASGKPLDERHPAHYGEVVRHRDELGVTDDLRLLGLIPYDHVAALMRASLALLNPSLFEGWSTPVEEARSLGVRLLLSDLDVHREQAGTSALYFDRRSPGELADALQSLQPLADEAVEANLAAARLDAAARVVGFGAEFEALANDVAAGRLAA